MIASTTDIYALTRAFVHEADIAARLTIAFLKAAQAADLIEPGDTFPPGFLLELGAVLRLRLWEREGTTELMEADLPEAEAAYSRLVQRLATRPESLVEARSPVLNEVLRASLRNILAGSRGASGGDVVVGRLEDREEAIDALARILRARRAAARLKPSITEAN